MGYIKDILIITVNEGSEGDEYSYSINEKDKDGYSMAITPTGITLSPNTKKDKHYSELFFPYTNIVSFEIVYKKLEKK